MDNSNHLKVNYPPSTGYSPVSAQSGSEITGYPPTQSGYPPPQGIYPPGKEGYPPVGGYPPPHEGYPSLHGSYPSPQGGYPPPHGGYPSSQGGYPPSQGGYPPPQGGYPPSQGGYPSPQGGYQPPQDLPVTSQPVSQGGVPNSEWMSVPQHVSNCPPGLEYLTTIDQLLVHQKVELLEAFTGFETQNKYSIKNSLGQKVYYAGEDSDCCTRNCCGPIRPFDMKIFDNFGTEVINLHRPLACDSCCCPCCLQTLEVSAPPGTIVGTVEQKWSIFCPKFVIKNPSGEVILRIEGPFCTQSCCCGDVEFQVLSADGSTEVGKITKQWSGIVKEMFTDTDNFGITFPVDLDVRMKAVMLGACFLIDFMFFEKTREKSDKPGMWQ